MRLFLYEFITGGGLCDGGDQPTGSLLEEGAAMRDAVLEDALRMGAIPLSMRDRRIPDHMQPACEVVVVETKAEHDTALNRLAQQADFTLVIAPEFDGHLLRLTERVLDVGGRLLSPGPAFIAIAADKNQTGAALRAGGARAPAGIGLAPGERPPDDFQYPAVLKPHDGAGSMLVRQVASASEAWSFIQSQPPRAWRLEVLHQGLAASCAVLCGPAGNQPLAPFTQRLTDDGDFSYRGGRRISDVSLQSRAQSIALRAVDALPATTGYVGVDLVLGAADDGADDVVIEINPRLTTSYVGLRAACEQNLLQAMLDAASNRLPKLWFAAAEVEFDAAGVVRRLDARDSQKVAHTP